MPAKKAVAKRTPRRGAKRRSPSKAGKKPEGGTSPVQALYTHSAAKMIERVREGADVRPEQVSELARTEMLVERRRQAEEIKKLTVHA